MRILLAGCLLAPDAQAAKYDGRLELRVVEADTQQPLAARLELFNARGKPVKLRHANALAVDNYLVIDGSVTLELKRGLYSFFLEAGPEFQTQQGQFTIDRHADDSKAIPLKRSVDMQAEGWWAADLDAAHRLEDMPLLLRAAGIDYVPIVMQTNELGKCQQLKTKPFEPLPTLPPLFGPWGSIYRQAGGGRIFIGRGTFPPVCKDLATTLGATSEDTAEVPLRVALQADAWLLPVWISRGAVDAVQILDRFSTEPPKPSAQESRYPRDEKFFPGAIGAGRWREEIYHHLLDCGLKIPPAAGSGSGVNGNPVGANRTYAYLGDRFTREAWHAALRTGAVTVTNGPLLRTRVEGHPPGHVFRLREGAATDFSIALDLTFHQRARVDYLEVIKNGETLHHVRLAELVDRKGRLPVVRFDESGWFAVRAVTSESNYYQFAATAPYYVEVGTKRRISRGSVQGFLDWLDAAQRRFPEDPQILADIAEARTFWAKLLAEANCD